MKKLAVVFMASLGLLALSGCDYFNSEERQAFKQFVERCKKDPSTADCKAWEESKNSPTGQ